jgi:uncharacterized damage-inducible protein DinB
MGETNPDILVTLAQYMDGPATLEAAVAGLSAESLDAPPDPPGWTIRQIAHHVVDGDDIWKMCIKGAIGNSGGLITFQWYWEKPQDEWAERWAYAARDLESDLALFRANRAHVRGLLAAVPDAWERFMLVQWPGAEPERITVREVVAMLAGHVMGHVRDIMAQRARLGV